MTDQPSSYPPPSDPPAYPSAPPAPAPGANPATYPGKTLGVVALVLSCIFFLGISVLAGLILGIVARVQSKRAGFKNGPALAAIIVASVLIVLGVLGIILVVVIGAAGASSLIQFCAENGPGTYTYNGAPITCS